MTNHYTLIHRYLRLVKTEQAKPIKCPEDEFQLVCMHHTDDEPKLYCYYCGNAVYPGENFYMEIEKALQRQEEEK